MLMMLSMEWLRKSDEWLRMRKYARWKPPSHLTKMGSKLCEIPLQYRTLRYFNTWLRSMYRYRRFHGRVTHRPCILTYTIPDIQFRYTYFLWVLDTKMHLGPTYQCGMYICNRDLPSYYSNEGIWKTLLGAAESYGKEILSRFTPWKLHSSKTIITNFNANYNGGPYASVFMVRVVPPYEIYGILGKNIHRGCIIDPMK